MQRTELKKFKLPDKPGVYKFLDEKGKILYIGKATSLKDRVRSYFANDLLHTRGKHIIDMVTIAKVVKYVTTDSALEALILEAALIKENQPLFNTKEKDNKSFNYVVATNEQFPRVLVVRERNMLSGVGDINGLYKYAFGPFPGGSNLQEALKIIRKIFPFRDRCLPAPAGASYAGGRAGAPSKETTSGKACFNRQIGLCPGVCSGEVTPKEYDEILRNIKLFFDGKKIMVMKRLKTTMQTHAKLYEFEKANEYKKMIFALQHIKDVSLLDEEVKEISQRSSRKRARAYRIEAYDIAHISGKYTVGVMVVVEDGQPKKSDYRKFKIRIDPEPKSASNTGRFATGQESTMINDTLHLEQVLRRRFKHDEWQKPDMMVIDGGVAQKRRAEKVIKELGIKTEIVSVVKDNRHKPRAIMGNKELIESYKRGILVANAESHRFAVLYHRQLREKLR